MAETAPADREPSPSPGVEAVWNRRSRGFAGRRSGNVLSAFKVTLRQIVSLLKSSAQSRSVVWYSSGGAAWSTTSLGFVNVGSVTEALCDRKWSASTMRVYVPAGAWMSYRLPLTVAGMSRYALGFAAAGVYSPAPTPSRQLFDESKAWAKIRGPATRLIVVEDVRLTSTD